ncbi:hypothetical protein [Streptomyces sp. NPDC090022]|uniref:hypothetical protein n=1 Tax=Streptomyces sp. NPDC090022 TaxID=3365920 RepID=UPI00381ACD47
MFEHEIASSRRADLLREAAEYRLVRQAKRARRSRGNESEGRVRRSRSRFLPTA